MGIAAALPRSSGFSLGGLSRRIQNVSSSLRGTADAVLSSQAVNKAGTFLRDAAGAFVSTDTAKGFGKVVGAALQPKNYTVANFKKYSLPVLATAGLGVTISAGLGFVGAAAATGTTVSLVKSAYGATDKTLTFKENARNIGAVLSDGKTWGRAAQTSVLSMVLGFAFQEAFSPNAAQASVLEGSPADSKPDMAPCGEGMAREKILGLFPHGECEREMFRVTEAVELVSQPVVAEPAVLVQPLMPLPEPVDTSLVWDGTFYELPEISAEVAETLKEGAESHDVVDGDRVIDVVEDHYEIAERDPETIEYVFGKGVEIQQVLGAVQESSEFEDVNVISAGDKVMLPSVEAITEAFAEEPPVDLSVGATDYEVQSGDWGERILAKHYDIKIDDAQALEEKFGAGVTKAELQKAVELASGIDDLGVIHPEDKLLLPEPEKVGALFGDAEEVVEEAAEAEAETAELRAVDTPEGEVELLVEPDEVESEPEFAIAEQTYSVQPDDQLYAVIKANVGLDTLADAGLNWREYADMVVAANSNVPNIDLIPMNEDIILPAVDMPAEAPEEISSLDQPRILPAQGPVLKAA